MEKTIKVESSKDTAKFFDKILANKRARKEEIRHKFKTGELKA